MKFGVALDEPPAGYILANSETAKTVMADLVAEGAEKPESDIEFGINLGMTTIFLQNGRNEKTKANFTFDNLSEVANALK